MAKKFFYVCAGLLCLVAAYQLGVSSARAQVQNTVWYAERSSTAVGVAVGRVLHFMSIADGTGQGRTSSLPPVPGSEEIVAFTGTVDNEGFAVLANGDVWAKRNDSGSWIYIGNLMSGATAVRSTSWGALKVEAR